jgi:hypothetical protein
MEAMNRFLLLAMTRFRCVKADPSRPPKIPDQNIQTKYFFPSVNRIAVHSQPKDQQNIYFHQQTISPNILSQKPNQIILFYQQSISPNILSQKQNQMFLFISKSNRETFSAKSPTKYFFPSANNITQNP